jgi:hypothetical protein
LRIRRRAAVVSSALGDVHRDFKAETLIDGLRSFPFHDVDPRVADPTAMETASPGQCRRMPLHVRWSLMSFAGAGIAEDLIDASRFSLAEGVDTRATLAQ